MIIARKAGGIEAVIKVINAHLDDPEICGVGCATLGTMVIGDGKCPKENSSLHYFLFE